LVEDVANCSFKNVNFSGPRTQANLTTAVPDTACIRFASTPSLICNQIVFDNCEFSGTVYGVYTDQQIQSTVISNSQFNILYQGVVLGTGVVVNGGPTGVRIVANNFDNIYAEGIIFGDVELNASGHNIFYDVGNHFAGTTNPATVIINIQSDNNISISDLFERSDAFSAVYSRILINATTSIAMTNSRQLAMGSYVRETGQTFSLLAAQTNASIFTVNAVLIKAFSVNYTIQVGTYYRTGVLVVTSAGGGTLSWSDDFTENFATGITLGVTQASNTVTVNYTSGIATGTMTYSLTHLA
jgi:hypothetical protein